MFGKEPAYNGTKQDFLEKYPAHEPLGKIARQYDAKQVREMMEAEELAIQQREQQNAEIRNRIERMMADHRLNMEYLTTFGVRAEHREQLLKILSEVEQHGGLSLQQSIDLANAMARSQNDSPQPIQVANGLSSGNFG